MGGGRRARAAADLATAQMAAGRARDRGAAGLSVHPRQAAARAGGTEGRGAVHRRRRALSAAQACISPTPVKAADAAPAAAPAPPTMPAFRAQLPTGAMPQPVRPAMLSYAVPHTDGPKPVAAAPAGSAADRPGVPGVEPAGRQGVAGDRRHLSADAGPVALRARYRDRERPARPVAVPSAGAGLQPQGRAVDGGGDAGRRPVPVDGPERREPADGGVDLRPHPQRHLGPARRQPDGGRSRAQRFRRRGRQSLPRALWRCGDPEPDPERPRHPAGGGVEGRQHLHLDRQRQQSGRADPAIADQHRARPFRSTRARRSRSG